MHPFTVLEAVVALNAGLLVGVPTDTVYGIAAHPWSETGMNALFDLKGRGPEHPIALLVADLEHAHELCVITPRARSLARSVLAGTAHHGARGGPSSSRPGSGIRPAAPSGCGFPSTRSRSSCSRWPAPSPSPRPIGAGNAPPSATSTPGPSLVTSVTGYLAGEGGAGTASTVLDVTPNRQRCCGQGRSSSTETTPRARSRPACSVGVKVGHESHR